jgi:hypothetical protein
MKGLLNREYLFKCILFNTEATEVEDLKSEKCFGGTNILAGLELLNKILEDIGK